MPSKAKNPASLLNEKSLHPIIRAYFEFNHLKQLYRLEEASIRRVFEPLPNGADYIVLWLEFEEEMTLEARLVRQINRLEMGLQASVYEHQGYKNIGEFFHSTDKALSDPPIKSLFQEVIDLRDESI